MKYTVQPLLNGFFTVAFKGNEIMKFPKVNNIPSFIFLITSEEGEHIIVDTGFDLSHIPGPDSSGIKKSEHEIPAIFNRLGIDPLSIKKLIQTHLHWDHAAGIKHFPNAEIYVQAAEFNGLFSLREFEETSFAPHHWLDSLDRFILLNGDCEIMPGIKLLQSGGHTEGHQGVRVNGMEKSIVLIGDSPFTYEWLWTLVPVSFWDNYRVGAGRKFFWQDELSVQLRDWYEKHKPAESLVRTYRTVNELKSSGDIALFSHDPGLDGTELY
ncbi:MAG TPA: MBL fold metallo-hydrolase [Spirochaetota bacterium]|nr:MBL fold metallo-hydrolase [Spirochaetota bacterium]